MDAILLLNHTYQEEMAAEWLSRSAAFLEKHSLSPAVLNPRQLQPYYTKPHALLYDLQKEPVSVDYLIMDSLQTIRRFTAVYPEKWLQICTCFNQIHFLDPQPGKSV